MCLLADMKLAGFEAHRLMNLTGFAGHHDFQTHITQRYIMIWQGLLFLMVKMFTQNLQNRKHTFEELGGFAPRRCIPSIKSSLNVFNLYNTFPICSLKFLLTKDILCFHIHPHLSNLFRKVYFLSFNLFKNYERFCF